MMNSLLWHRQMRFLWIGVLSVLGTAVLDTQSAYAVLELVADDLLADSWPGSAPVRTSFFEPSSGSRGLRGERLHYQTFSVTEAFSLDKLFVQYEWAGVEAGGPTETNFTKVRIYEITRTYNLAGGLEDAFTLGDVVVPQASFIVSEPGKVIGNRYAIELNWNAETSGELILQPRTDTLGYAVELTATHIGAMSSAISLIQRATNPNVYPGGRAYEFISGSPSGPFVNGLYDFPIVITAVPDDDLDGDFNFDGTVDAADYVVWQKNNSGDPLAYEQWVQNFGLSQGGGASAGNGGGSVPEPASWLLISTSLVLAFANRRMSNR